mmetsp:Transcript_14071/g.44286  ORF Transcript_14071/g.44286 Transcript_14071/m.44286 type:complete len:388 (-) Transcript_14071:47-1210(-)
MNLCVVVAVVVSLLCGVDSVSGHARLNVPTPRTSNAGVTSNGPCGDFAAGSQGFTAVMGGSSLKVDYTEAADHTGTFRFGVVPTEADMTFFSENILANVSDGSGNAGAKSVTITIPNIDCASCMLAMQYDIANSGANYYGCADVTISVNPALPLSSWVIDGTTSTISTTTTTTTTTTTIATTTTTTTAPQVVSTPGASVAPSGVGAGVQGSPCVQSTDCGSGLGCDGTSKICVQASLLTGQQAEGAEKTTDAGSSDDGDDAGIIDTMGPALFVVVGVLVVGIIALVVVGLRRRSRHTSSSLGTTAHAYGMGGGGVGGYGERTSRRSRSSYRRSHGFNSNYNGHNNGGPSSAPAPPFTPSYGASAPPPPPPPFARSAPPPPPPPPSFY